MPDADDSSSHLAAYPEALRQAEAALLKRRRERCGGERNAVPAPDDQDRPGDEPKGVADLDIRDAVGFALSGGGIRSATFCLGLFQGLAKSGFLKNIDYLSTVSGGGYFGAFYGRLFTRDYVKGVKDAEAILVPEALLEDVPGLRSGEPGKPPPGAVFRWLRENGRYLSPKGAGDLLLGSAVLMRNWAALQVVVLTLLLAGFLVGQVIRVATELGLTEDQLLFLRHILISGFPGGEQVLWWSPYILAALFLIIFWIIPVGWAYWLLVRDLEPGAERRPFYRDPQRRWQYLGVGSAIALAVVGLGLGVWVYASMSLLMAALLTLLWSGLAVWRGLRETERWRRQEMSAEGEGRGKPAGPQEGEAPKTPFWALLFEDAFGRHWISSQLRIALVVTGGLLAWALIDTLGQTLYALYMSPGSPLGSWAAGIFGIVLGLAASARRIAVIFSGKPNDRRRISIPLNIVATAGAIIILAVALIAVAVLSHAVAWDFERPKGVPPGLGELAVLAPQTGPGNPAANSAELIGRQPSHLLAALSGFGISLVLSFLFGRSRPFLNWSTHHPLYSARLTRAYLGASNPRRWSPDNGVTDVIPGDDMDWQSYFGVYADGNGPDPYGSGAPLHLINVTINETVDGRSQIQQQDRKGMGMALGPAGLSVGVKHHLVFARKGIEGRFKIKAIYPQGQGLYRVFEYPDGEFRGETLSLGHWVSISGAAFSTGLGSRTNLGLSLLTGLGNVRLGYWWNSAIELSRRARRKRRWFTRCFPVQSAILREFFARFPGTSQQSWYLSDGGHFENMGAYELIRRQLRRIVVIDAEADPDYTFEGLANLVRKARLDFQTEIRFLGEEELDDGLDKEVRRYFGPIDHLRRGRWAQEPFLEPNLLRRPRNRICLDPVDHRRLSRAHAALARIEYPDSEDLGWLLYIKPTLMGDEPADVQEYHSGHSRFPQEPTIDQFFDEAQWESYRRLGEHIAHKVFTKPPPTPHGATGKAYIAELLGLAAAES